LTSRTVLALPLPEPPAKQIDYFDDAGPLPGFSLRVTASGKRVYTLFYRAGSRKGRLTIGDATVLRLAQAREKARAELAKIRVIDGYHPGAERREARQAARFADLVARYIEENKANLAPKTARDYKRQLEHDIAPTLGKIPARELRRPEVKAFLEKLAQRAPVLGNRVFQLVRATCRWAVREGLLDGNPSEGLRRPRRETPRERFLEDDEIAELWRSLDSKPPLMAAAVRLVVLLAPRIGELLAMRWHDLALDAKPFATWTLPGVTRKGGGTHTLPLPRLAARIIGSLRPLTGTKERVFDGLSREPAHWFDPWRDSLLKAKKVNATFHRHDLRRTAATGCARLGAAPYIVDRVLGHRQTGIVAVYDRFDRLPEMASALNAWASHVERLVGGEERHTDVGPLAKP
jgi:integrase